VVRIDLRLECAPDSSFADGSSAYAMSATQMGGLFERFVSNNGRNGHLKSVETCVPSRFVNKAALITTNGFGAVTHTERRFQFRLINRRSQHVLNGSSVHWSGLTRFNRRPKASTLLLTS